ncbi:MAG: hypothetical protein ACXW5W_24490, partial [Candidatus Binatia bacterium]
PTSKQHNDRQRQVRFHKVTQMYAIDNKPSNERNLIRRSRKRTQDISRKARQGRKVQISV